MHPEGDIGTRRAFLSRAAILTTGVMVAGGVDVASATPPSGTIVRTELAKGRLIDPISLKTDGPQDWYIQRITVEPGADTGWHTHPGTALDVVTAGAVTVYTDQNNCEPRTYRAGEVIFVPAGVAHFAKNEGSVPAEVYITYLVTADAEPRIDAPVPEECAE